MAKIVVSAERVVDAPADAVYRYVSDMRDHHPHYLPPAFSDFQVESGGVGAGTITRFKVTAGGRRVPSSKFNFGMSKILGGRMCVYAFAVAILTWILLNGTNPLHFSSPA